MPGLPDAAEAEQRARLRAISSTPDPETTARYVDSLLRLHPDAARRILATPAGVQTAAAIFSNSRFLSEEVIQRPEWLEELVASPDLYRVLSAEDLAARLSASLPDDVAAPPSALPLAAFRRRQLLRIVVRDVLGLATLPEITDELSNLADAILDVAVRRIRRSLTEKYGRPLSGFPGAEARECGFSVIALGKLGGRELNYSSDIDLMFVYSGNGETSGPQRITAKEFFKKLANSYTELLSTYTREGMCYRVDLRLRPDGRHGEVCISLEGARAYYADRARDWELQMLIKARIAAGEAEPGRELLEAVEPRIYSSTLDFCAVEAVSVTRERIHEKLASRRAAGDTGIDIKLARGGIRDIEFLVQCLQRLHGGREPWVRHGGTQLALRRLNDKDLISDSEYARLSCAYEFLRHLEHRLQMVDDRQTHTLPRAPEEIELLARRMPPGELGRAPSADKLLRQINLHLEEVQELYDRVIHSQQPLYYSGPPPGRNEAGTVPEPKFEPPSSSNLIRFLDQRAPGIAAVVGRNPLRHGARRFEAFLEKVFDSPGRLELMNRSEVLTRDILEIFELSPYFAEELIRRPELMEDVERARQTPDPDYSALRNAVDPVQLRRVFRREMLRIQAESICVPVPVFETLGRTSDLADAVIASAYDLARGHIMESHPPQDASYEPRDQLMVIALGRLGMREFDLGSDADLNFILPDEDAGEMLFWTRVAERLIDMVSAYTGEGMMFAIDTRLRPNGREGMLVQTAGSCKDYIAGRAEAWEGIAYMKSRCVAGNSSTSTNVLHELQEADWRRYGQSGRSRSLLRDMRARLERELGDSHPLKAAAGGYYDIDFSLMYLRLRSAGIFFKVLNTPERIDIVEKMGHLDRADAVFLNDAATLYRAIDHGLRVYSGQAEGRLPNAAAQVEALTSLVRRWTPEHLHDQPLPDELGQIQATTRIFFRRLFG